MLETRAYAAFDPKSPLRPHVVHRRDPRDRDVVIDIAYCGVCHSDLHTVRNEWQGTKYPVVPGHEIVGRVAAAGRGVTKHKVGDVVAVGCMVGSCGKCGSCKDGLEPYCDDGPIWTYGSDDGDPEPTAGGYSTRIVVREDFVLRVRNKEPLDRVAPLLCAGVTTYSPLKRWSAGPGTRVAVLGLGGLGHVALKLARAMGAEVSLLTSTAKKRDDALRLGAHDVIVTSDDAALKANGSRFDLLLDTVSAPHDLATYARLLRRDGTMVLLGIPETPSPLPAFALVNKRRSIAGSLIGGIAETQEMLDFCAEKGIAADVETIPIHEINRAYERMLKSDVRYRFVIDAKTFGA